MFVYGKKSFLRTEVLVYLRFCASSLLNYKNEILVSLTVKCNTIITPLLMYIVTLYNHSIANVYCNL